MQRFSGFAPEVLHLPYLAVGLPHLPTQVCSLHALGNLAVAESSHQTLVLAQAIAGIAALCCTHQGGYDPHQATPSPMVRGQGVSQKDVYRMSRQC